jgi:hypothetical protein
VQNFIIEEYAGLSAIPGNSGYWANASLLEHILADKVDYFEHTREFFRDVVVKAIGARVIGRTA